MTLLTDIKSKDWGFSIEKQGEVVTDLTDINQCIYIILMTVKGTDPLRPEFGCDVFKWLDRPVSQAIPNMMKAAAEAIKLWEPRVVVTKVSSQLDVSTIKLTIEWETVTSKKVQSIQVQYNYG